MNKKTGNQILAVAVLLLVWQGAAMLIHQKILMASPFQVLVRLTEICREKEFWTTIAFSLVRIGTGFLLGMVLGCFLAILSGRVGFIETLLWPVMTTIKAVPVASFIILSLIWLNSSQLSIFISFLMVLPIVYTNVLTGIHTIDPKMNQMADVYHLSWSKRFAALWIPQIRAYLYSACTVSLGIAWKSGIAAEVIGIPDGSIGEKLYQSKAFLNTVDLFAWTVVIVLLSTLFEKLFLGLLNLLFRRFIHE